MITCDLLTGTFLGILRLPTSFTAPFLLSIDEHTINRRR